MSGSERSGVALQTYPHPKRTILYAQSAAAGEPSLTCRSNISLTWSSDEPTKCKTWMRSLRCPRRKRPTPPTLVAIVVLFCSRVSCGRQSACAHTARRRPAGRASRTSSWGTAQRFSMLLRQTSLLMHRRSQNLALMVEVCANAALKPALSPIHARPLKSTRVLRVPVQLYTCDRVLSVTLVLALCCQSWSISFFIQFLFIETTRPALYTIASHLPHQTLLTRYSSARNHLAVSCSAVTRYSTQQITRRSTLHTPALPACKCGTQEWRGVTDNLPWISRVSPALPACKCGT